ncbi:hypothetical protein [Paenibacillus apiarius]|uniref:hypothetical protein n=1 Tax=Paenibacillus apiarius TaxID=46240 RepID=UPI001981396F|nr:hypothetical protein [Paenibacillus apiarius]
MILLNSKQSENKAHNEMELICMDLLVPQDRLLRLIDKHVDFSFIREKEKELEKSVNEDRENHGKKPLPPRKPSGEEKLRKVSQTDPKCGLMKRNGKPEAFCYLDHRTVDHKYNIITDVHVTPSHVNDATV